MTALRKSVEDLCHNGAERDDKAEVEEMYLPLLNSSSALAT